MVQQNIKQRSRVAARLTNGAMKTIDPDKFVKLGEVISLLRDDYFMPKRAAAQYCGVSVRTFESWTGLQKYKPSGMTLFRKSELDAFMKRHQELPTSVDLEKLADEAVRKVLG